MKQSLLLFSSLVAAAPSTMLEARQQKTLCEQYAYWSGNGYEANNNMWGKSSATSGQQCLFVDSNSASGVSWRTTWTWQGGQNNVKSYPYVGRQLQKGRTIASIGKMQTSATWKYSTSNHRAAVAYDIFTAANPNHPNSGGDFEIMIW
jgi:xyloglucan-specific endo-beta-1,4-glucanase